MGTAQVLLGLHVLSIMSWAKRRACQVAISLCSRKFFRMDPFGSGLHTCSPDQLNTDQPLAEEGVCNLTIQHMSCYM